MKTKPILFSTEMVQAILSGTKIQTRRLIKPQPTQSWIDNTKTICKDHDYMFDAKGNQIYWINNPKNSDEIKPKFIKGDVMWVRETTKVGAWNDDEYKVAFDYIP